MGDISLLPIPKIDDRVAGEIRRLAKNGWSIQRNRDSIEEISHSFLLPLRLRSRVSEFDFDKIDSEIDEIRRDINTIVFDVYGVTEGDRASVHKGHNTSEVVESQSEEVANVAGEEEDTLFPADQTDGLLSWAVGVSFGRFDWRLATGERVDPLEPGPFDPLPAKSPGMLPDDLEPFQHHAGVLVDDGGHMLDLAHRADAVLARVDAPVALDVRQWMQRDFFPLHLQRYSKSRRKSPIYWPLATASGSYTLWLYYPLLTSQTLYTAVNDFLDPKLKLVRDDAAALRSKADARSREDERAFEALQVLEAELIELREALLQIAPTYRPNHHDGVQINAAPLWPLFRYKPWQKLLRETWAKLEKGEYDWAHLAMAYWPDRVREKCKTDKSLAIAHNLEHLYVPSEPKAAKPRGRKKASDA